MKKRSRPGNNIKPNFSPFGVKLNTNDFFLNEKYQVGLKLFTLGRLIESSNLLHEIVHDKPNHFEAQYLIGIIEAQNKNDNEAFFRFEIAAKINPKSTDALYNCGFLLQSASKFTEALEFYNKCILVDPNHAKSLNNIGLIFQKLGRHEDALKNFQKALIFDPNYLQALNNYGYLLFLEKRLEEALAFLEKAILVDPNYIQALNNYGLVLKEVGRFDEALIFYDRAISINPNFAEAFCNRGTLLQQMRNFNAAASDYYQTINLNPNILEAYNNLATILQRVNKRDEALLALDRVISINPYYPKSYFNRAFILQEMGKFNEAILNFEKVREIDPDFDYLTGILLLAKLTICDWTTWDSDRLKYVEDVLNLKNVTSPFPALIFSDEPKLHKLVATRYIEDSFSNKQLVNSNFAINYEPSNYQLLQNSFTSSESLEQVINKLMSQPKSGKLRLGFFSADFRFHPVSLWLAEQIEGFDKSKFELIAFSFMSSIKDPMRIRLENAFDWFLVVDDLSDAEIVQISKNIGIDIAFDLSGHTMGSRPDVFEGRAAPIQISHLGYPSTQGAKYIDYLISDLHSIPIDSQHFYVENIAYVNCPFTYDKKRTVGPNSLTRAQLGIPDDMFVFTCQNTSQKISKDVFIVWMEILLACPKSVLWLLDSNPIATKNLLRFGEKWGVGTDRFVFTKREISPPEQEYERIGRYLAGYRLADLFLDTWPYNAGTTAVDALWAGLPVLTKSGVSAVSRMATSALFYINMPELVTNTPREYFNLAVELACDKDKLISYKNKLEKNREICPLFNSANNTKAIEDVILEIYSSHGNRPPEG